MDGDRCVLCDFVDDSKVIAVGYREWLESEHTDDEICDIVQNVQEVRIKWPADCDVGPPADMKLLKDCKFVTAVAKILAYGEWAKMCTLRENIINYGVLRPSKNDRRSPEDKDNVDKKGGPQPKKAKLETKALKAKRPGFTDERYNETSYYVEN
ncbi:uncharacterized protein LOC111674250, partial [Orussus abietinus]|uniref:uncharacterized protein LOC111674250 n=1 Tax=Orussus abietinus TaxID=222816 RepID=UPI000C715C33